MEAGMTKLYSVEGTYRYPVVNMNNPTHGNAVYVISPRSPEVPAGMRVEVPLVVVNDLNEFNTHSLYVWCRVNGYELPTLIDYRMGYGFVFKLSWEDKDA